MANSDGSVEIDLGKDGTLTVYPLYVSAERTAQGGDTVEWGFEIPEGTEPVRVVCILAQLK